MNTNTIPYVNGTSTPAATPTIDASYPPAPTYTAHVAGPAPEASARTGQPARGGLDEVRYWVGVGLTALIAVLVGLVGLVLTHGIFHISMALGSGSSPIHSATYGLAAAGLALLAGALFNGMLRVAPRPALYYGWIAGMVSLLAALLPFTATATLHTQIALGSLNLAVGLVIALLVPLAAINARR